MAARSSRNRPAGFLEWHNESVTRDVYRRLLLEKVVPGIRNSWPRGEWNDPAVVIRIQQDGPHSHISADDDGWLHGLQNQGVENKILLFKQPANSPDLNINDLGFFRALQSNYMEYAPTNAADIIANAQEVHRNYPATKINRIYLSLMGVMNEFNDSNVDNDFDPPQMKKDQKERMGDLPIVLPVTNTVLQHLERN